MVEIDKNTVVVFSSEELKNVLEQSATYSYIYLGQDITLEEGIVISSNKPYVIIDGTYLGTTYTYTVNNTDADFCIKANVNSAKVTVRNLKVVSSNAYGIVCCPSSSDYQDVVIEYSNVRYNGVEFAYHPYGKVRVIDCVVTIEETFGATPEEAIEGRYIEVGGDTTITNNSADFALFTYRSNVTKPSFTALPNSRVILTSESKEFMQGTNRLFFTISHGADVVLTTGNGFASYTVHGVQNATIEKHARFTFIEKSHLRIPMWTIYGSLTVEERS